MLSGVGGIFCHIVLFPFRLLPKAQLPGKSFEKTWTCGNNNTHKFLSQEMISLSEVKIGERVRVQEMNVDDPVNLRLMAFGLTPGVEVEVVHVAPLGDPIAIVFCSQKVMVRRSEAEHVKVVPAE